MKQLPVSRSPGLRGNRVSVETASSWEPDFTPLSSSLHFPPMRPFLVCVHDATPAYLRETGVIIRDLAPLLGRRFSFGVVPDWHGEWLLTAHPDYCQLLRESADELLLHG